MIIVQILTILILDSFVLHASAFPNDLTRRWHRLITKVVPVGKQVYALGKVSRDNTSPNNLVLSQSATEAFLLQYGLEGSIASNIRSSSATLDTFGNVMMGVGGCFLAFSAVSFATAGNTKTE